MFFVIFFITYFLNRFLIDFSRFWKGCGRVLAGQSAGKIEILGALGDIMLETFILVDFCMIFDKIDDEKYIDFVVVFNALWNVCVNARNLKNRAPVGARAQFLHNRIFQVVS